ncbi:MAG: histidine--tRNA ligase [Holosporales bacterium]|jgi:histidyl-tRNA synthetase|nr:histidine--tRNA ligase [Holosporales bacterium]
MFRPVRGMKDLYGIESSKYEYIRAKAMSVCSRYGYSEISTPMVEYSSVFQRAIGDDTDVVSKEMYTFVDRGGESITLRPEGTAGVIRAVVTESLIQTLPVRLMYCGEMFRYDRPQKGRFRQFRQFGCEHIGEKSPYVDATVIAMAAEILNVIGIFGFEILVNSLGDTETMEAYTKAIVKYFSRHEKSLSPDSQVRLAKNPLRILDSKDQGDREICSMAPIITDYFTKEAGSYFCKVCELLSAYGLNYEINNFLVRGLDYYTHTAFEFKSTAGQFMESIGGGGRYDKLLNMFGGPDVSGVGFAFGIERLMLLLDDERFNVSRRTVAVIPVSDEENDSAFSLFRLLHSNGISAEFIHYGNMGKKMKTASKLKCELALIIGEEEKASDTVTIKFMNTTEPEQKSRSISSNDVAQFVKNILS